MPFLLNPDLVAILLELGDSSHEKTWSNSAAVYLDVISGFSS
jgi:hypothetical protein